MLRWTSFLSLFATDTIAIAYIAAVVVVFAIIVGYHLLSHVSFNLINTIVMVVVTVAPLAWHIGRVVVDARGWKILQIYVCS